MAHSIDVSGRKFVIRFRPSPTDQLKRAVKLIGGYKWNHYGKCWEIPMNPGSVAQIRAFAHEYDIPLSERAQDALSEGTNTGTVEIKGNVLLIDAEATFHAQSLLGPLQGRYNYVESHWKLPITPEVVVQFPSIATDLELKIPGDIEAELEKRRPDAERTVLEQGELYNLSYALETDFHVEEFAGELYPFQDVAAEYALRTRRTFIGDDMGGGKTASVIATLLAADAFPAIVTVPSNVKLKWRNSFREWAPDLKVEMLSGMSAQESLALRSADVVLLNHEIFAAWTGTIAHKHQGVQKPEERGILSELDYRAVVYDESHYFKTKAAARTRSALLLTKYAPDDVVTLMTTGTATKSRPEELIAQIQILDRMHEFGGVTQFKNRYCGDNVPPEALRELNRKMRERCYVRRLKKDLMPQLPEMQRATVPMELSNFAEYKRAEADVVEWLTKERDVDSEVAKGYAHAIAEMNTLKKLAAQGKMKQAVNWIKDVIESEKLVVFAHHKEIQQALVDAFPGCERISGDQTAEKKQAAVDRFQKDRDCRLIVCSLQAGSVGITLTAATNVAFLELGWTPGDHDQAEARIHRIGQRDGCTAWYLIAPDTIDETIAALIDQKRKVTSSVNEGTTVEGSNESVIEQLMKAMRA